LFGRGMVLDEEHLAWMEERFTRLFQRPMPAANRQQAMLPEGARKLKNNHGSAPGIWLEDERGRWVAMLPGVPRELRGMLGDPLLPLIRERSGAARRVVRSRTLRTTGVGESLIADRVATLPHGVGDVDVAYLPNAEGTDLRLTVRGAAPEEADRRLADSAARLRSVLDDAIYGENDADLAVEIRGDPDGADGLLFGASGGTGHAGDRQPDPCARCRPRAGRHGAHDRLAHGAVLAQHRIRHAK
jgi:nicotinamide-nucleotide amidase